MSGSAEDHEKVRSERQELQERIAGWLDAPLTVLAFVMLALLLVELAIPLSPELRERLTQAQTAIWAIFVTVFVVEFILAPSKLTYLRRNWITAISAVLPVFRAFRVLRVARALRGISLVRILTTLNRGARALGNIVNRGQLGYVLILTIIITLTAASGVLFFERGQPGATITSPGEAIWWSTTVVTTINAGIEPQTLEGRVVGVLLRIYALGISGYLTAIFAVYLLGWRDQKEEEEDAQEIRQLRQEIALLRQLLEPRAGGQSGPPAHHD